MDDKDVDQMQQTVRDTVLAMMPAIKDACTPKAAPCPYPTMSGRTHAEIGSPEFAEDRTQVNSLNNKWMFESGLHTFNSERNALLSRSDQLFSHALEAMIENNALAKKLNGAFFNGIEDTRRHQGTTYAQTIRHADDNAYVTRYDLSNPVTTGTGNALTGAAYTPNRATDTANAGQAVNAEAVSAAVAKFADAINPILAAAVGDAVAAAFKANFPVSGGPQNTNTVPTPAAA